MPALPSRRSRAPLARALAATLLAGWVVLPARAGAQATSDSLVTLAHGCPMDGGGGGGALTAITAATPAAGAAASPTSPTSPASPASPTSPAALASRPDSTAHPSLVLRAAVSAREIRFTGQPRVVVRLCGAVGDSVRVLERRNLPSPVVAGTTYRDVYVAVEILGHLDGQCLAARLTGAAPDSLADGRRCASLSTRSSDR